MAGVLPQLALKMLPLSIAKKFYTPPAALGMVINKNSLNMAMMVCMLIKFLKIVVFIMPGVFVFCVLKVAKSGFEGAVTAAVVLFVDVALSLLIKKLQKKYEVKEGQ